MDAKTRLRRVRQLHIDAALQHGEAAEYWAGRGDEKRAALERRRARIALDAADWAELHLGAAPERLRLQEAR